MRLGISLDIYLLCKHDHEGGNPANKGRKQVWIGSLLYLIS